MEPRKKLISRKQLRESFRNTILNKEIAPHGVVLVDLEDYCLQTRKRAEAREQAAKVIQSAFRNDPGIWWMAVGKAPDSGESQQQVADFLSFLSEWEVLLSSRKGIVLLSVNAETQEIIGVCCVLSPHSEESYIDFFIALLTIKSRFWGFRSMQQRRAEAFGAWQKESRKRAYEGGMPIFLSMLGVRPDWHGRGIGKAMLQALNFISDDLKTPIYLETSLAKNVEIYKKSGYRILENLKRPVQVSVGNCREHFDMLTPMLRLPTTQ